LKIKTNFLLGTFFTIIVSIAVTAFVLALDSKENLKQDTNDKAKLLSNDIRGVAVESLVKNDMLTLNLAIKNASETNGVIYIFITDRNGFIIASNNPRNDGRHVSEAYPMVESSNGTMEVTENKTSRRAINYVEDLEIKNKNKNFWVGKIYVGFDSSYIDDKVRLIYIKSGLIALAVIIAASFFVMYTASKLIAPLYELMKGTEIIANGDLKYRIKVNVKNEFQALANSFNMMTEKLNEYYEGILNAFTIAIDSKHKYTPGHSRRVAKYALSLGRALQFSNIQMENLRIASILMDIGNLGVKDAVLTKAGVLSPEDFIQIQKHPEISARILKNIPALKEVVPIIIQHHERFDGMGYPSGLKGDQIMPEARVLSLADAYDAMVTEREHRKAMSPDEALYELRANKEKQFDPRMTEVFVEVIHKEGGI
jgi:HD-GYP domain-containing protein (c-di-GMP phosphodiesterase class II)